MLMADFSVDDIKQGFDKRRPLIIALLVFLCVFIVALTGGALALAWYTHFTVSVMTFAVTTVVLAFMALIGIIGSYIFAARWENSDFLKVLPDLMPHMAKKDDDDK